MKDGLHTTEFWINLLTVVSTAGLSLAVVYGLFTNEEAQAWAPLVAALVPLFAMLIQGWLSKNYAENRTQLKLSQQELERSQAELEAIRLERM